MIDEIKFQVLIKYLKIENLFSTLYFGISAG